MAWLLACVSSPSPAPPAADDSSPPSPSDTAATDTDGGDDTAADTAASLPEWTLLVYLNGDNDLEQWALGDLNEMEETGSSDRVHILVQLDRSAVGVDSDGDWSGARRYRVEQDDDLRHVSSPVLADLGAVDSGAVQTFVDFVDWGVSNYPAQRYAFVIWDHGEGWALAPGSGTKGVSQDYDAGTELSPAKGDITAILSAATTAVGGPLDLFGYDACLMQSWETAHVAAPYARYQVASEDYTDFDGWAYDRFLPDLHADPTMDAGALAESIALRFHEIPDSTLSAVDLSRVAAIDVALDELAAVVMAAGSDAVRVAASGALGFDGKSSREHDLLDLLDRIGAASDDEAVVLAAHTARERAAEAVAVNYNQGGQVSRAMGMTIFSPASGGVPDSYRSAAWSAATRWDEMLDHASR